MTAYQTMHQAITDVVLNVGTELLEGEILLCASDTAVVGIDSYGPQVLCQLQEYMEESSNQGS